MFKTDAVGRHVIWTGDCLEILNGKHPNWVDVVVTSPPYNLDIKYNSFADDMPREAYLNWMEEVLQALYRAMKAEASLFLNLGCSSRDPWIPIDVANRARGIFHLQNQITWVKSISINDQSYGHFKPINSPRFLNHNFEWVLHFTKTGDVPIDRLAIGVPYQDKSNLSRGTRGKNGDIRCAGNTWFLPYETIQTRDSRGKHPATFPVELAERCIRLAGIFPELVALDPFLGSGTTLVAAEKCGVFGYGCETDPEYARFSVDRVFYTIHPNAKRKE